MRRDELFRARTPRSLNHRKWNRIIRRTFRLPSSFLLLRFSLLLSRACGPLLILPRRHRLPLSRTRASVRNLPRDYSLASIPIQPEYSPGDTVFLDIFLRPTATRKCGACFSSCHVLAHDDRTLSPRIYVAKHASRELSMMKFENGTIPFSLIHLHCHHRQYIL